MPFSFLLAGFIASFSALSYAELSSKFPKSAGEAIYLEEAFSIKWISILAGWSIVIVGIVSVATLANGIVGYTQFFIGINDWIIKISLITILFLVSIWGVKESVFIASIITVIELIGILLVIYYGFDNLLDINKKFDLLIPPINLNTFSLITFGSFLSFYAYIGFEDMVNMAEEVKNPRINLPISIIIVLIITTILYILVALVAVLSLPLELLSSSNAPFIDLIKINSNFPVSVIVVISLIAVLNGMLIQIIMASRILFGMANNNMAPQFFSYIYSRTKVPLYSSIFVFILIILAALALPLVSLAKLTSTIILIIFTAVNLSLVIIKRKNKKFTGLNDKKQVSFPIIFPIIGFLLFISFLIFQLKEFI